MPLHCTSNELKVMNDAALKNTCFVFLGEEGRVFFLCLSLIKKAKTRICLYTENRLKKHQCALSVQYEQKEVCFHIKMS